jgi:SAM-dependent methyltransferase
MTYDHQIASDYAKLRVIHLPLLAALISGSRIHAGSRVLELACGTGNYIRALQSQTACSGCGADPSREMLREARSHGAAVAWVCAPAEKTGLANNHFDFVFSVDAVHHFYDRTSVFREAYHVLSTAGTICIATDSEETIRNRNPLSIYWPETVEVELARYPRIETLETELRDAGFGNLRIEEISSSGWVSDLSAYKAKVFSCLRLLSEDSYRQGLERLETDLARGPVPFVSRYCVLWAQKSGSYLLDSRF